MSRLTDEKLELLIGIQKDVALETQSGILANLEKDILSALQELKEYRDIGPTPEQLREIDQLYLDKCREVNEVKEWIPVSERLPEEGESDNEKSPYKALVGYLYVDLSNK